MKRASSRAANEVESGGVHSIMRKPPFERLVVGSRVHCILHGGMDGIVFAIQGEQKPETIREKQILGFPMISGGNAEFDIIFTGKNAHISKGVHESIVHSIQWRIVPGIANEQEIQQALSETTRALKKRELNAPA